MSLLSVQGNPFTAAETSTLISLAANPPTGTVTTVSVTTANGVSGSVANASSTPAITLTLGAITPTSVNGLTISTTTGTLTITNGKTLSVSNTLTFSGTDSSSVAFGSGGTVVYTTVTSLASLATVGTISSGTWQGTTVGVAYGGTGQTTYTDGQLLIGNSSGNTLTKATITAGSGITVTNGNGSITIAASGGSDGEGNGTGVVWVKAMEAHEGTGTRERKNTEPCIVLSNGADENCSFTARIPSGKTTISAIKMYFINNTSGNLFIDFDTIQNEYDGGGRVFDTGAGSAAFTVSGTSNQLESITVPSTSYDGLGTLAAGDLITVLINRTGTSGSDTYESDLHIVGVEFTFGA